MKHAIQTLIALFCLLKISAQGSSCSSPIAINLNGVINSYSTSTSLGLPVVCSAYATTSPVTWFSFTTNATTECPLLNITASDHANCEIALYTDCAGNMTNNLEAPSSMCFDDGEGLWAPSQTFSVLANHTYYLRVKTSSACTISIGGQYYTPSNNNCIGATSVTTSSFTDNNACHKPSTEVTPGQLCAFTLENTAFYKFYVASAGSAIINISSIACDNGDANNSNGFQIGFFTGSCGALVPINCTSGSGSFVQATTNPLPAGSLVYVAIDGVSGSNCQYSITGINVVGVLSTNLKNFSAWKTNSGNTIKWICVNDSSAYYIIERSVDGSHFTPIGQVNHPYKKDEASEYSFEDLHPMRTSFYRIKQLDRKGSISLSQIITVVRNDMELIRITMQNPVRNSLHLEIDSDNDERFYYAVFNLSGQCFLSDNINCKAGVTQFQKNVSLLPAGKYVLILKSNQGQISKSFVKLN